MTGTTRLDSPSLRARTAAAVADPRLRRSLAAATDAFEQRKERAYAELADPAAVRAAARSAKAAVLRRLPEVLERLADTLEDAGAVVHWAADDGEARERVLHLMEERGARRIVKSKSMLSEEIELNGALEDAGAVVTETDLGEWIIQLAKETPSHIIVPAIHKDRDQIRKVLEQVAEGDLSSMPEALAAFAREKLRERFLEADMGISGVNFAVAETGTLVLVTNEGNGRLTTSLPRVHVALLGMERIVETWDQLDLLLALLPRAATGQAITTYVSAITGPRRTAEADGPQELHVVIVDNGRTDILGTEFTEMLACIRCGACLNACPVYRQTGGHAYGWVYPGPMGAVLTPLLHDIPGASEVPNASSLCGACWEACPVAIPLQDMLLALRRRAADEGGIVERAAWRAWAAAWSHPATYRASLRMASLGARMIDPARVPGPPQRWALDREVPAVPRRSFRDLWQEERGR